ncbi:MAG: HNH endonuclease family protein [Nocardioides sp.]
MRPPRGRLIGAALSALLLSACASNGDARRGPDPGATAVPSPTSPRPATSARPALESSLGRRIDRLLARVPTTRRSPYHPGYDRDCDPGACVFGKAWTDVHPGPFGGNRCTTRQDVLLQQMREIELRWGSTCRIYQASLRDPYTGTDLTWREDGYVIRIDHVYPLAEAWHAGAWAWPAVRRVRFANDVRRELLAVGARANDDKGAKTPAEWLPPDRAFHCEYVLRYLRVADAYQLSVTEADAVRIRRVLLRC